MFDPIIHSGLVFVYAAVGLAVAVWRLCKVLVASIAAGVLAVLWEREGDRAGHYQEEEKSDEKKVQGTVRDVPVLD